jgi:preprotein translocase subunit SecY
VKKFIKTLKNIWSIEELRNKITFTLLLIFIYIVGTHIVLPGIDPNELNKLAQNNKSGGLLGLLNTFVGGSFNRASIFALGIMPYISASIFMQYWYRKFQKFKKKAKAAGKKLTNGHVTSQ